MYCTMFTGLRIEITTGGISLESGNIWVSTDVTKGTLQDNQEVVIELTLEVFGGKYNFYI